MKLPWRKREPISLSELVHQVLSFSLKETNKRLVHDYLPRAGDDLANTIAIHYRGYVAYLVSRMFTDLLERRRLKTTRLFDNKPDFVVAWQSGLAMALQDRSRDQESYDKAVAECITSCADYERAYHEHRADAAMPPMDRYFSACRLFCDLVAKIDSADRWLVFDIAKDMYGVVATVCASLPKRYVLTGG